MANDKRRGRLTTLQPRVSRLDTRSAHPSPKEVDSFYHSPEWLALRDEVIERAGGECQWPGCGRSEGRMFVDHRDEIKDGGAKLSPENCWTLCGKHHTIKTAQERAKRMRA